MDDFASVTAALWSDETLTLLPSRSEISFLKIGHALSERYDKKIFRTIALAASRAHPIQYRSWSWASVVPSSVWVLVTNSTLNPLSTLLRKFAAILDEKNTPAGDASLSSHYNITPWFLRLTLTSWTATTVTTRQPDFRWRSLWDRRYLHSSFQQPALHGGNVHNRRRWEQQTLVTSPTTLASSTIRIAVAVVEAHRSFGPGHYSKLRPSTRVTWSLVAPAMGAGTLNPRAIELSFADW